MVGDGRLPQPEGIRGLADRGAAVGRVEEHAEELEAGGVGDCSEGARQFFGCRSLERRPGIRISPRRWLHPSIILVDRLASMSGVTSIRGVSVLADPSRAAILRLMLRAEGGRVLVGQTANVLGLRQPTVSHHMKALLDDGVIAREPAGRLVWYSITPDQRGRIDALLEDVEVDGAHASDLARIVDDLLIRFGDRVDREDRQRGV